MVALSEDARLDRLERHVSSLWEQLHALSASMLQHAREGAKRDDKLIGYCGDLLTALKLIREELHGRDS
jgi:phosphoenolpyruvate-protein kinase (PTS system EI component)